MAVAHLWGPGTPIIVYYPALLNTLRTFFEIKERMVTLEIIHVFIKMFFLPPPVPMMHFLFSIIGFQANNSNFLLRGEGCSILGFGYESPPPTKRSGNHPVGG